MKNTIQFNSDRRTGTEVLRLSSDGIWANPDIPADDAAKKVLEALDSNIKVMVQKAVEAEREKVAAWMMARGYATGHGDSVEDLLQELDWQIREQEREACAKVPQEFVCSTGLCRFTLTQTGVGIGERGMQAYEEAKKRGWVGISDEQPSEAKGEQ